MLFFSKMWSYAEICAFIFAHILSTHGKNYRCVFSLNLEKDFRKYGLIFGEIFVQRRWDLAYAIHRSILYTVMQVTNRGNLTYSLTISPQFCTPGKIRVFRNGQNFHILNLFRIVSSAVKYTLGCAL